MSIRWRKLSLARSSRPCCSPPRFWAAPPLIAGPHHLAFVGTKAYVGTSAGAVAVVDRRRLPVGEPAALP